MKISRSQIAIFCGLMVVLLIGYTPIIELTQPQTEKFTYSFIKDATQAAGALFLIFFVWLSGSLYQSRKRLSIVLLLLIFVPAATSVIIGLAQNYRLAHQAKPIEPAKTSSGDPSKGKILKL